MRKQTRFKLKLRLLALFFAPWLILGSGWWLLHKGTPDTTVPTLVDGEEAAIENPHAAEMSESRARLARELGPHFLRGEFPTSTEVKWDGNSQKVQIDYSLDPDLQAASEKLLKSYHPDYGAVVVMDAVTGRVLAMSSFQKGDASAPHLALRGTFPAASVFKIVTATAAVDRYRISPNTSIFFNGANYTLYKQNVMTTKRTRWTREMTIREAFARSINTVFGRLTLEKLKPQDLQDYAVRFGFNRKIDSDLPFDPGFTEIPNEKVFHLAEMASGYNKVTRMSPIQGAMIAASVAAGGKMPVPTIVDRVVDDKGHELYKSEPVTAAVTMSPEGSVHLREMMESTILNGTSRKTFRQLVKNRKYRELEMGGKTGSLTGDNPKGKVDWFVGYAIGGPHDKLAVAAITVNVQKWTVKSSFLAQSLFQTHFKGQFTEGNRKFFRSASARRD